MPITFVTFGLGYLAIIGVPPFAGFFSKDAIIETAVNAGGLRGVLLGGAALLGAGITAFYMTRVMLMTFFGRRRWEPDTHPHESPASMTAPMVVLAIGSVGAGALLSLGGTLATWLEPVVGSAEAEHGVPPWVTTVLALSAVAVGVLIAYRRYAAEVPRTAKSATPSTTTGAISTPSMGSRSSRRRSLVVVPSTTTSRTSCSRIVGSRSSPSRSACSPSRGAAARSATPR
jgi:NADH-quinone oxidoreductase subunit L